MSAISTLDKIIKALLKTHPNPTLSIQELYDECADERVKEEIQSLTWGLDIEINEEEK